MNQGTKHDLKLVFGGLKSSSEKKRLLLYLLICGLMYYSSDFLVNGGVVELEKHTS